MQNPEIKPWYKKKRYLLPIGTLVALSFVGSDNSSTPSPLEANVVVPVVQEQQIKALVPEVVKQESLFKAETKVDSSANLSNDNYYTNTAGNKVHSPAYSNTVPVGASAQCRDGTYSFSQSRRGTCSHHGGVAKWL